MIQQFFHEVIDYRDLASGLTHHFFPSEQEAKAWIGTFLPAVRHQLAYTYRAWGAEALAAARIVRHATPPSADLKTFEVNVRGAVNATKTLTIQASNTEGARNQARAWMAEHGDNPLNWDLSSVADMWVESVDDAP